MWVWISSSSCKADKDPFSMVILPRTTIQYFAVDQVSSSYLYNIPSIVIREISYGFGFPQAAVKLTDPFSMVILPRATMQVFAVDQV